MSLILPIISITVHHTTRTASVVDTKMGNYIDLPRISRIRDSLHKKDEFDDISPHINCHTDMEQQGSDHDEGATVTFDTDLLPAYLRNTVCLARPPIKRRSGIITTSNNISGVRGPKRSVPHPTDSEAVLFDDRTLFFTEEEEKHLDAEVEVISLAADDWWLGACESVDDGCNEESCAFDVVDSSGGKFRPILDDCVIDEDFDGASFDSIDLHHHGADVEYFGEKDLLGDHAYTTEMTTE